MNLKKYIKLREDIKAKDKLTERERELMEDVLRKVEENAKAEKQKDETGKLNG